MIFFKKIVKRIIGEKMIYKIEEFFYSGDLDKLAQIYNTDKYGRHTYTPIYANEFKIFKGRKLNILEIGVGGYDNPLEGGASLKMWKRYFSKSKIYSIDLYDKSTLQESRIKIFQGDQEDFTFLEKVVQQIGVIDIIIDDGSHINQHVIASFRFLFPKLKEGGVYVIEDTQTSYWSEYGGIQKIWKILQ